MAKRQGDMDSPTQPGQSGQNRERNTDMADEQVRGLGDEAAEDDDEFDEDAEDLDEEEEEGEGSF
jgi:hypothetical protein